MPKKAPLQRERSTVIYGVHPVVETLRTGKREIQQLYLGRDLTDVFGIEGLLDESRFPIVRLSRDEMAGVARSPHHQGIAARVGPFPYAELDDLVSAARDQYGLLVMLDGVQDPANVGSILRSAECLGAYAVVLTRDRSAPVTPAVEKTASGASAHVPVARVVNLVRAIEIVKRAGYWVYATGSMVGASCYRTDLTGKVALVLGSEGKGVRRLVKARADGIVSIPMRGRIASLSVSQAATVLLSESLRQRLERERL